MASEFEVQCIARAANPDLPTGIHLTRPLAQSGRQRLQFSEVAALLDASEIADAMSQSEVSMSDLTRWRVHNVTVHRDLFVAGAVPLAEAADRIKYVRPDETRSATFTVELIAEDLPELPDQVLQQLLAVGRDELRREVPEGPREGMRPRIKTRRSPTDDELLASTLTVGGEMTEKEDGPHYRVRRVNVSENELIVELPNGREIAVSPGAFPALKNASEEKQRTWRLLGVDTVVESGPRPAGVARRSVAGDLYVVGVGATEDRFSLPGL